MNLNQLTATDSVKGMKKGRFTSEELVKSCLERIKSVDDDIKGFLTVEKGSLEEARKVDEESDSSSWDDKPLLGVPVAVKDNFCTEGLRTTAGSEILEEYTPVYDATVVRLLKEAGAIIIGKTNMDAWAHGSSTEASDFFTTHNPWDLSRVPGGSSGGSAASVIADESIFATGSETAGSIRQPSSWCGVTGLKPTYGRVSRYGLIAMGSSVDSPGPITKSVRDAALILQVLAGKDDCDATTSSRPVDDYSSHRDDLKGVRIGLPKEYFKVSDDEVGAAVMEAARIFEDQGAEVEEVSLLDPKYSVAVYTILQRSEVSSNLARFDGVRYGKDRDLFGDEAKRRIMLGAYALSSGYFDQYYKKAQKVRTLILEDMRKALSKFDVLVAPTSPTVALELGEADKDPMFGERQDILVESSTLAGLPGLTVPCGFSKEGLPIGMQIIGRQFEEGKILGVGGVYQELTDYHKERPEI